MATTKKKNTDKKTDSTKKVKKNTKVNETGVNTTKEYVAEDKKVEDSYGLINTTEQEIANEKLDTDGAIVIEKNENLEIKDEDTSVIAPIEKKGTVKKIREKVNQYFGYLWNGQMID